jgi:hypothetical protein
MQLTDEEEGKQVMVFGGGRLTTMRSIDAEIEEEDGNDKFSL